MKEVQIEGIATISKGGFSFDSGLPSNEQLCEAQTLKGRLGIKANGCIDFRRDRRYANLPPDINSVTDNEDYKLKRTSRHYIVQIKVPIMESRSETQERFDNIVPVVIGDITIDRKDLFGKMVA